ncbi:hypothetical protein YC2023_105216 [Brassica napus]
MTSDSIISFYGRSDVVCIHNFLLYNVEWLELERLRKTEQSNLDDVGQTMSSGQLDMVRIQNSDEDDNSYKYMTSGILGYMRSREDVHVRLKNRSIGEQHSDTSSLSKLIFRQNSDTVKRFVLCSSDAMVLLRGGKRKICQLIRFEIPNLLEEKSGRLSYALQVIISLLSLLVIPTSTFFESVKLKSKQ